MEKASTCEKCGKEKIFKSVQLNQSIYDNSDDEYPQWVVESVKIEGTPILADVCLACGQLTFSIDPQPLRLKLEHNLAEIVGKKKKLDEETKIRTKYQSLVSEKEKLNLEEKKLKQIEERTWLNEKQSKTRELELLLQKTDSEIKDHNGKINALLEQQRKKQSTLKELGLTSENNPDLVKNLVEQYENLKLNLLTIEKKSKDISQELQSFKLTSFVPSQKLISINASISLISSQIQEMVKMYTQNFFNQI
jgi:hypothetical protein